MEHRTEVRRTIGLDALRGKSAIGRETGEKLGEVTDIVLDPASGRVLGLALKTPGGEMAMLPASSVLIGSDAVMVAMSAVREAAAAAPEHGVLGARDIAGASVVTENGQLLGRIGEVHVSLEEPRVYYRVIESAIQRFLGGGFYMRGDVLRAYSPDGPRMIVPADTEAFAASSLQELTGAEPAG